MLHTSTDKTLNSWISVPQESDFPLQNIPFGIAAKASCQPKVCTRIGDTVIDLSVLASEGYFQNLDAKVLESFDKQALNDYIALGSEVWSSVRERLITLFSEDNPELRDNKAIASKILSPLGENVMYLPVRIGDYTDFYSSMEHASNVGMMFRDPANALLPNWKHIPVGYHGRSSSIVVSGTNIHRPKGQIKFPDAPSPIFSPTRKLDFELEMAFIVGKNNSLGDSVSVDVAENHIFGMLIFNDLSARDIQNWEYVPLGPFLSKNFGSVVSPWVVTMEALQPFKTAGPVQETEVLPYLKFSGDKSYDIKLEVCLQPEGDVPQEICESNHKYLYWNISQQLAHHTVNGCNLNIGDLCASGTISGPEPGSFGSMLEICWNGSKPLVLNDGKTRTFIDDKDTIIMKAFAVKDGLRIGFGECATTILPAKS